MRGHFGCEFSVGCNSTCHRCVLILDATPAQELGKRTVYFPPRFISINKTAILKPALLVSRALPFGFSPSHTPRNAFPLIGNRHSLDAPKPSLLAFSQSRPDHLARDAFELLHDAARVGARLRLRCPSCDSRKSQHFCRRRKLGRFRSTALPRCTFSLPFAGPTSARSGCSARSFETRDSALTPLFLSAQTANKVYIGECPRLILQLNRRLTSCTN